MIRKLLLCALLISVSPAHAVEIDIPPVDPTTPPHTVIVLKDAHPKVYKASKPLRLTGRYLRFIGHKTGVNQTIKLAADTAKWIGEKSQPYQPFMNLVSSGTNAAISTGVWFKR